MRPLVDELNRRYREVTNPDELIAEGAVLVDGRVVTNPRSVVAADASIAVRHPRPLRGEAKLQFALDAFEADVPGRVALDLGAAAGGFTRVLLAAGAARVYAVDAGHGQLLGSLRQDERVVNLERTNLADLSHELVPEPIDLVTIDLSYLSLADAVPQLDRITLAPGSRLLALVKPQFELHAAEPPKDEPSLREALRRAEHAISEAGWTVLGSRESPVRGTRGSTEFFVFAEHQPRG